MLKYDNFECGSFIKRQSLELIIEYIECMYINISFL